MNCHRDLGAVVPVVTLSTRLSTEPEHVTVSVIHNYYYYCSCHYYHYNTTDLVYVLMRLSNVNMYMRTVRAQYPPFTFRI